MREAGPKTPRGRSQNPDPEGPMQNSLSHLALATCASLGLAGGAAAQSLIFTLPGNAAGDGFGEASRPAGDVDGDGICDLILGSRAGVTGVGYARIISGTNGTLIREFTGAQPGDYFGRAVAGVGDLNGDSIADVIIGAALGGAGAAGRATVYSGLDGSVLHNLVGTSAGDHFGWSVVGLSDLDGDLVPDFAVGAVNQGASRGMVSVFSGATGALLRTHQGTVSNQLFGHALAATPDINGDGIGELLVGAPHVVKLIGGTPGEVFLLSGKDGLELNAWSGHSNGDAFGSAVAHAGDVDGDSVPDVIVGAPQPIAGSLGYARVFSGATGLLMYDWAGAAAGDQFGAAVASAGDVNLDGQDDIAIGAPGADVQGQKSGSVHVISGQAGLPLFTEFGSAAGHEFGSSLGGGGDINGDGVLDLIVASPGDVTATGSTGSARVLSPQALTLCGTTHLLSLAQGTGIPLHIDAGAALAGRSYELLGSIAGTTPGTAYRGLTLSLNRGRYFKFTQAFNPNGPVSPPVGLLDGQGLATASFSPPLRASAKWLVGRTFHHALVVFDASGTAVLSSNAWPVTITH